MFIFCLVSLFIIKLIRCFQEDCDIELKALNDKFTYLSTNDNELNVYLGNELMFLNIKSSEHMLFYNDFISISNKKDNSTLFRSTLNKTKVYNCKEKKFLFMNSDNKSNIILLNFKEFKEKSNQYKLVEISNKDNNFSENVDFEVYASEVEYAIINYKLFAYFLILFGCLISSYGAYHFIASLLIHLMFFIYFLIGDFISFFTTLGEYILFILFSSFLISCVSVLILKPKLNVSKEKSLNVLKKDESDNNNKTPKKILIINSIYGANFGFTLYKTLIYYSIYFNFPVSFFDKNFSVYFVCLFILCVFGVLLHLFDCFKKYRYIPCCAVAGSFYIIKGIEYIIGGYYSSILYIKEELNFDHLDGKNLEISLTYFVFHMAILIYSIIFQIKYIQFKENTYYDIDNISSSSRESIANTSFRPSNVSINEDSKISSKEDDEALLGNGNGDENSMNEENDINDQED